MKSGGKVMLAHKLKSLYPTTMYYAISNFVLTSWSFFAFPSQRSDNSVIQGCIFRQKWYGFHSTKRFWRGVMYTGIALKNLTSLNSSHSFYTGHSYTYNPTGKKLMKKEFFYPNNYFINFSPFPCGEIVGVFFASTAVPAGICKKV